MNIEKEKKQLKEFEDNKRTYMVGIKLNKKEFKEVNEICEKLGISKSKYFRYLHTRNAQTL